MILPDTNLLIYAHDSSALDHPQACQWWQDTLNSATPVGIPWVVVLAFTRLMSHPVVCTAPLSPSQVREIVLGWFSTPQVRLLRISDAALPRFYDLLEAAGTAGNLTTDALIALHAMEHSAVIYSNDSDFDRFPGLRRINPLT